MRGISEAALAAAAVAMLWPLCVAQVTVNVPGKLLIRLHEVVILFCLLSTVNYALLFSFFLHLERLTRQ